jgi:UDP-N-acetylmuramate dehydrogenase
LLLNPFRRKGIFIDLHTPIVNMRIVRNVHLKTYNTFGIDVKAKYFVEVDSLKNLEKLASTKEFQSEKKLILGGGSNVLFTQDFEGLVIKINLKGIHTTALNEKQVIVSAAAGEVWHDLVLYSIQKGLSGLENLSLIPGCVGASPIQNIGAYGVEVKDYIHTVEAYNIITNSIQTFTAEQCRFGYRDSIFKNEAKNKFIITQVNFILSNEAKINTSYGAIEQELQQMGIANPTSKDVSDAVCSIRNSKLPNPKIIGNAGSFFKNPIITNDQLNQLREIYPTIISYKADATHSKLAAGWMIEQCGWKGKTVGQCGVHSKQSLVLINHGNASGKDVYNLSELIISAVKEKFHVTLEREVNIL